MLHASARTLKLLSTLGGCAALAVGAACIEKSAAQSSAPDQLRVGAAVNPTSASPIYGVTIPAGYRDWKLISVNHLITDKVNQLRAQLGNDIAIKAFKEGRLPFPDGAIIVALHWNYASSEDNNKVLVSAFPGAQSFVAGSAVNMQIMVKDSKRYPATGGWGFADFRDGKAGDRALHETCFPCHEPARAHDFVFAHYAPTP
ncbi:MAG TPA: cytochrome P460 family protein [Steroidobacteraceae bacterium]|nr:cytochrome P460 family protein [Steroidobacteraceae bacterium]